MSGVSLRRCFATASTGAASTSSKVQSFVPAGSTEISLAQAKDLVNSHPVVVFSRSLCPYSMRTKGLLFKQGLRPFILELDYTSDGGLIHAWLRRETNLS